VFDSEFGNSKPISAIFMAGQMPTSTMDSNIGQLSSLPVIVHASPEEISDGRLTWKNLELAVRALHRDGLVVLGNVILPSKLDKLNKKMVEDALILQSRGENSPYNYNKG
jgi:hypothetical protein